ncbi:HAD-IA family hydrolase [Actinopolymorpha rutila]
MLALSPARVNDLLWTSGFSADCDAGDFANAVEVREHFRAITDFAGTDDELDAAWCSAFRPDHRVRHALELHRGSLRLALFTNNGPLEEEVLRRQHPEMFDGFEHLLFSHHLGHRKPDPVAFTSALSRLSLSVDDVLFIDDNPDNVDAARCQGWAAFQFLGPESVEQVTGMGGPRCQV